MAKKLIRNLLTTILLFGGMFGGVVGGLFLFSWVFLAPISKEPQPSQAFIVERDQTIKGLSKQLEEQGFVRKWWAFYLLTKTKKEEFSILKPGEYQLSTSLTPKEIMKKFISADIVYHDLLIPEGTTVKEVGALMAATTLVSQEDAERVLGSQSMMRKLDIPASSFEGYVFPAKYRFTRPDDAETIISTIVAEGKKRMTKEMVARAIELGLSVHQVYTLASIIEKETGVAAERPLVSSVLHNRLKLGMPLQVDPTVIYGIPDFNGNLTKEDLRRPSPYNTYINVGLPPGPICNPGIDSVLAALNPADTAFLYFVSKGDGTSQYSATYKEHQEAVRKYQFLKKAGSKE